jgi:hypothetical protein
MKSFSVIKNSIVTMLVFISISSVYGQFTEVTIAKFKGTQKGASAWGDFDKNGKMDVLITGQASSGNFGKVYKNNGDSTFSIAKNIPDSASNSSFAWTDYNNDGYLDFFIFGFNGSYLSKLYQNTNGTDFSNIFSSTFEGIRNGSICWTDNNKDGLNDLFYTGFYAGNPSTKVYQNNNTSFALQSTIPLRNLEYSSISSADYNNDGNPDILLAGDDVTNAYAEIYKNTGINDYKKEFDLTGITNGSGCWGDYDNDGYIDIMIAGATSTGQTLKIYKNNSGSGFVEQTITIAGIYSCSVAWGDYDNDGDLDILLAGNNGTTRITQVYKNNNGTFALDNTISLPGVDYCSVSWVDFDNDGDLDIFLSGATAPSTYISKLFKNKIATINTAPNAPSGLTDKAVGKNVVLGWTRATDDHTPSLGLTHNIRIGTTQNGYDIVSPMADPVTGVRYIPAMGNAFMINSNDTIKNLKNGLYYWSVQAIDNCFKGGAFATEDSFYIRPTAAITVSADSACISSSITFNCITDAGAGATYAWTWDNGSVQSGSGKGPYAIQWTSAGIKTITVIVTENGAPSYVATKTVKIKDNTISNQPANTTVCAGSNATFSVTATNTITTYQWQIKRGGNYYNLSNGAIYSGIATKQLTVVSHDSLNSHIYRCSIVGACNNITSSDATLTVTSLPLVTIHPKDSAQCDKGNVSFSVSAIGAGLGYQWQEDKGTGFANLSNSGVYSTVTTSTMGISGITSAMNNYKYRCIVSGTCPPTSTSNAASLTINTLPVISSHSKDTLICFGSSVSISASCADPNVIYSWGIAGNGKTVSVNPKLKTNYVVTVTDQKKCAKTDTVIVSVKPKYVPEICIVRYDNTTAKNMVVWEKPVTTNIKSYNVFKEFGSNKYQLVTTVPYAQMSAIIDSSSDPDSHADRYKLTAIDSCGNESDTSFFHKTPHIIFVGANIFMDDNYQDESGKFIPDFFYIYRGPTKSNLALHDSLTGTFTTYTDPKYLGGTMFYQVGVKRIPACTPTGLLKADVGPYTQSLSNIVEYKASGLDVQNQLEAVVFPNPFSENLSLEFMLDKNSDVLIEVVNATGQKTAELIFKNLAAGNQQLQLNVAKMNISEGMCYLRIIAGDKTTVVKCNYIK